MAPRALLSTLSSLLVCFAAVQATDIIRVDPSIRRVSNTEQVSLASVSIANLHLSSAITLDGLDEELSEITFTKIKSKRTVRDNGNIEIDWSGAVEGSFGEATIRMGPTGTLTGSFSTKEASYELVGVPSELYEVRKTRWDAFPEEKDDDSTDNEAPAPDVDESVFASIENTAATVLSPDNSGSVEISIGTVLSLQPLERRSLLRKERKAAENTQVDLLIVVTNAGMCQYAGFSSGECENNDANRASIETRIPQLITQTNAAFQGVGSTVEIRHVSTVYMDPSYDYLEPDTSTLSFLRTNANIAAWRNEVGADLVAALVGNGDYCGYATVGPCTNCYVSVTNVACFGQYSFTHELGRE